MRQGISLAIFALSMIVLSCAGNRHSTGAVEFSEIADQKWQLIELNAEAVSGKVNGKVPYLEFRAEEQRYVATGGCNTLHGEYTLKGKGGITFAPGITTMMACEDMETDRALTAVFAESDRFELLEGILTLSKSGKVLGRFKALDRTSGLVGNWELESITGSDESFDDLFPNGKPTLEFEEGIRRVHGRGGCNSFNGAVKVTDKEISFGPIASTKMGCKGNGEPLFFQTLDNVSTHIIKEDELTLYVNDEAVMHFKKAK